MKFDKSRIIREKNLFGGDCELPMVPKCISRIILVTNYNTVLDGFTYGNTCIYMNTTIISHDANNIFIIVTWCAYSLALATCHITRPFYILISRILKHATPTLTYGRGYFTSCAYYTYTRSEYRTSHVSCCHRCLLSRLKQWSVATMRTKIVGTHSFSGKHP